MQLEGYISNIEENLDDKGRVYYTDMDGNPVELPKLSLKDRIGNNLKAFKDNTASWFNDTNPESEAYKQRIGLTLGAVTAPFGLGAGATKTLGTKLAPVFGKKIGQMAAEGIGSGLVGGGVEGFTRGAIEGENPLKTMVSDATLGSLLGFGGGLGLGKIGKALERKKLLNGYTNDLGAKYFDNYVDGLNNQTKELADFRGVRAGVGSDNSGLLFDRNSNYNEELDYMLNLPKGFENPNSVNAVIGDVGEDTLNLGKANGLDLSGEKHILDKNGANHIKNAHSDIFREALRDQLPITDEDLKLIPDIVYNHDNIQFLPQKGKKAPRFVYSKQYPDGETYYVEYNQNKNKQLASKTMYKKNGQAAYVPHHPRTSETSPTNTSVNDFARNFKSWYGDAVTKDKKGAPIHFWHGSGSPDIQAFDMAKTGASNDNTSHLGFWFTPDKPVAEGFAEFNTNRFKGGDPKKNMYEVLLNLKNPKIYKPFDATEQLAKLDSEINPLQESRKNIINQFQPYLKIADPIYSYMDINPAVEENNKLRKIKQLVLNNEEDLAAWYGLNNNEINNLKNLYTQYNDLEKSLAKLQRQRVSLADNDPFMQMQDDLARFQKYQSHTNPDIVPDPRHAFGLENSKEAAQDFVNDLKSQGYDGIIIQDTTTDTDRLGAGRKTSQYVVFDPTQIKSVNNEGTFDPTNPNIYKSLLGGLGLSALIKQQSALYDGLSQ